VLSSFRVFVMKKRNSGLASRRFAEPRGQGLISTRFYEPPLSKFPDARDEMVKTMTRSFAVIPAAGKSSRMGSPKLLLPLGGATVLARVVSAFRQAGIETVVVVVAPGAAALAEVAKSAGAEVVILPDETAEMRASIAHGLDYLKERHHPVVEDRWLLAPADHPVLDAGVISHLIAAGAAQPKHPIVLPAYQGQRGHPVLLSWEHAGPIRALPAGQGVNVYLRQWEAQTLVVPVSSASVLTDLDTMEDYERLVRELGR
jgi:molybdenum cofactor cytidylyltransferase